MVRNFVLGRFLKSTAAIGLVLLFAQVGHASEVTDPLKMFQRYFGTIDIVSKGRGLRGTGQLDPDHGVSLTKCDPNPLKGCLIDATGAGGVPSGAHLVSAFLYWETLEKTTL